MKLNRNGMLAAMAVSVLALTLGMGVAPATASETHHGVFTSGIGVNTGGGLEGVPAGTYDLQVSGPWNLNIGTNQARVTGNFRVFAWGYCPPTFCQSGLETLLFGDPWASVSPGVYRSTYSSQLPDGSLFQVVETLYYPGLDGHDVTLTVDLTGSPFHWTQWTLHGVEARS
jgi:hypothetical protein